jgi:hypothetical protein
MIDKVAITGPGSRTRMVGSNSIPTETKKRTAARGIPNGAPPAVCVGLGPRCGKVASRLRFFVSYRNQERKDRWKTIGAFEAPWTLVQARKEAQRLLGLVATSTKP